MAPVGPHKINNHDEAMFTLSLLRTQLQIDLEIDHAVDETRENATAPIEYVKSRRVGVVGVEHGQLKSKATYVCLYST